MDKNTKLIVGYLGFHKERLPAHELAFHFIKQIKPENKKKVFFLLCYDNNEEHWKKIEEDLKQHGIQVGIKQFPTHKPDGTIENWNYILKCICTSNTAIASNIEFCCKMDEDVFISNHSWDYILENIERFFIIDDILAVSPIITNGIPSAEIFIRDVLAQEERERMYNLFYNSDIGKWWGVDYSFLSNLRKASPKWDSTLFFNMVRTINHWYKGVHPIRFSKEAQITINDFAMNHIDKIINKQNYIDKFYIDKPAYLCNTFYFIKTKVWNTILRDKSLFRDGMDEVPLNLFRERHNLTFGYIGNLYCVHLFYNSIENHTVLENEYVEKYKKLIL